MTPEEKDLIYRYLDQTLPPEQEGELEALLNDSEEARALLRFAATIDEHLGDLAQTSPVEASNDGAQEKTLSFPSLKAFLPWGLAAGIVAFFFALNQRDAVTPTSPNDHDAPLARIVDEAGAGFDPGYAPAGGEFDSREYRLTEGVMHFRLRNGASVVMQAPAEFVLEDAFRLQLQSGRLRPHANNFERH